MQTRDKALHDSRSTSVVKIRKAGSKGFDETTFNGVSHEQKLKKKDYAALNGVSHEQKGTIINICTTSIECGYK